MAKSTRIRKGTQLRYFILNGEVHKVLRISRSEDLITAWNFSQHKRCTYIWSVTKGQMQKAFTMKEVSRIFSKNPLVIHKYIQAGSIRRPFQIYQIGTMEPTKFIFSEDDLRELHAYLLTVHRGRPRNDGQITNSNLMSRAELEAMMKQETILYTKDSSGEYVPVWKQPDW